MALIKGEFLYVLLATAAALVLHTVSDVSSLVLVLPALISFTTTTPLPYLIGVIVAAELWSLQPPGIMTIVVLTPWLILRLFKRARVDFSVSFFLFVTATVLLQFVILLVPEVFRRWRFEHWSLLSAGDALALIQWPIVPWLLVPIGIIFTASVIVHYNRTW
jgi:hypothetical protein